MDWSEIAAFSLVAGLLVASPGPNGVLIAKTVPCSGRLAGFVNIAGFIAAFYLHGALSVLGISILLVQSAAAFTIVKYLGAAYLIWIGLKALYAAFKRQDAPTEIVTSKRKRGLTRAFGEGLLTNALNPKVSMFYLAAFPQFMAADDASAVSGLLLVSIHSMLNLLWFGSMVLLFGKLTEVTRTSNFRRRLQAVTGIAFIGFGWKLATHRPAV